MPWAFIGQSNAATGWLRNTTHSVKPNSAMPANDFSPFNQLNPRAQLSEDHISEMIEEIEEAITEAHGLNYFTRMELNHDTRFAWWPGQTNDGRKWKNDERTSAFSRLTPGQRPPEVFPWNGSSDVRVRLVEEVIRDHNTWKRLALQRRQERVGPRNLSPEKNPQAASALWAQVSSYYDDITKRDSRREGARFADIAHEYGHSLMNVGWNTELQAVKKTLTAEQLQEAIRQASVANAEAVALADWVTAGGDEAEFPGLDPEQTLLISEDADRQLIFLLEAEDNTRLVAELLKFDDEMPPDEAARLARSLEWGEPAEYYAVSTIHAQPSYRALTYGIDVLFPPTSANVPSMRWIVMPEWVSEVDLRGRINDPHFPYNSDAVDAVLEHPGKSFQNLNGLGATAQWLLSGGGVRSGIDEDDTKKNEFQILHVYYLACAVGNVRALYHTVLHAQVKDQALYHECCEHAHGRYPFFSHQTELHAPYLLASRGYGEQSFTDQEEIKGQRDSCSNNAQIQIKPPMRVPLNLSGGSSGGTADLRPGLRIPMKQGTSSYEKIDVGGDSSDSQMVQQTTLDAFNAYWCRGSKVDPELKQAFRQVMVSEFLTDFEAIKEQAFQLVQEFSPTRIRSSFFNGLPTSLDVSREEIQGRVGIELDYDVGESIPEMQDARYKGLSTVLQFDNQNLINREPILKALVSSLLPSHFRQIVADSAVRGKEETSDEQDINSRILSGTLMDEASTLIPGTNHALRLQVMQRIYGLQTDKKGAVVASQPMGAQGQASRAQRIFSEDPDVQQLVLNRLRFHAFQLTQQENAQTGKLGVEPVAEQQP